MVLMKRVPTPQSSDSSSSNIASIEIKAVGSVFLDLLCKLSIIYKDGIVIH